MTLAITAYISRVDGCKCGDNVIHLYPGTYSEERQEQRKKLLVYIKGSNKAKKALGTSDPILY